MQLLVIQCRHYLKFFQHVCALKHRMVYTRPSPNRPFSRTPTAILPLNSVAELAPTKSITRTVTSSVSPPEEPDTFRRPQSSEVAPMFSRREIINPTSPATQFGIIAGVFLRHTARSLGFRVLPDGYIRISDVLSYGYFRQFNLSEFAHLVKNDPMNRFEIALLPDLVDGIPQNVWWVRTTYGYSMPGVNYATRRIYSPLNLRNIHHITHVSNWDHIREHGISEGPDHFIQLLDKSYRNLFHDYIPIHANVLCISINPAKAMAMGVKFFHTKEAQLLATGDWNRTIPFNALESAVELEITKESLR